MDILSDSTIVSLACQNAVRLSVVNKQALTLLAVLHLAFKLEVVGVEELVAHQLLCIFSLGLDVPKGAEDKHK